MTPSRFCGTIPAYEARRPRRGRRVSSSLPARGRRAGARPAAAAAGAAGADKVAEAYAQFLLGHHLEDDDDDRRRDRRLQARDGARSAGGRHSGRARRPVSAAEPAAGGDGGGRAGAEDRAGQPRGATACSASSTRRSSESGRRQRARPRRGPAPHENLDEGDSASRAGARSARSARPIRTCARRWRGSTSRARVVRQGDSAADRSRQPGAGLAGRPAAAGARRTPAPGANADAIAWLEERAADDPRLLPTLADFYERERRWTRRGRRVRAARSQRAPRNAELKTRYASALLNAGGRENLDKARDVLTDVVARAADRRARAVSAVAGAAAARRLRGRGSDARAG